MALIWIRYRRDTRIDSTIFVEVRSTFISANVSSGYCLLAASVNSYSVSIAKSLNMIKLYQE
jgi:hypothetical protein